MHKIGFVVAPGFQMMGFAVTSVFEMANRALGKEAYRIALLSEHGGLVQSSLGFGVETQAFGAKRFDTVILGASSWLNVPSPALTRFARHALKTSRRLAAFCTATFQLAATGVLDGRRATTHWRYATELRERFPQVIVEEDRIFVVDGPIWTSAGMSAGIDLALAMVEDDHGAEIARKVARTMVVYHRRAGGQSQFSALLELEPKSDRVQQALDYARKNLQESLSVEELAEVAHLSPRQFSRLFQAETGQSPAKAVERLRVESARLLLEDGSLPIEVIARETGFADRERMRRAFLRTVGQPPQAIRRNGNGASQTFQ